MPHANGTSGDRVTTYFGIRFIAATAGSDWSAPDHAVVKISYERRPSSMPAAAVVASLMNDAIVSSP